MNTCGINKSFVNNVLRNGIQSVETGKEVKWKMISVLGISSRSKEGIQRGLPFPSPEDLPDPETKLKSPVSPALAGGFFTS